MIAPRFLRSAMLIVWILFLTVTLIGGDRTNSKIYETITGTFACFRRMNATHEIGCSSKLTGNVGVLHLVNSEESLKWVTETGPHSPYVAVMTSEKFTRKSLTAIRESGRVEGILLLKNVSTDLTSFSGEKTCPNRGYGLYTKPDKEHFCEAWNEDGSEILFESWDFPIFLIDKKEEADKVLNCFQTFNEVTDGTERDWPLCAAQLESHMLAAVDSQVCMRRNSVWSMTRIRICDPMGDYNIYGSIVPRKQSDPYTNGSVIVVGARLDSSSMFDKISPGADSTVSGFAALVAVLKHLSELKDKLLQSTAIENIYFMVFNGEAFDYIGSSRIVYDMKRNVFPFNITDDSSNQPAQLRLEHIKYFIEFNQVSAKEPNSAYFVHSPNSTEVSELVSLLTSNIPSTSKITITNADDKKGLPPSSFQSFRANRNNMPGIVITNHAKTYKNKYYNSIYDDDVAVDYTPGNEPSSIQMRISELAATVAGAIVKLSLPEETHETIEPDPDFVDDILYCYLKSSNCSLFTKAVGHELPGNSPMPLYVGVQYSTNPLTIFTRNLLAYYQGHNVSKNINDCVRSYVNQTVEYLWINEACYETTVNFSAALSPAFTFDGEISWDEWNSGLYSTWTESVWQKLNVRIFLKPSRTHELLTLCFGIAIFLVSFVIIGWISKKSDVIFQSRPDMIC